MKQKISLLILTLLLTACSNECQTEKYEEYPCEGATHYARLHRNYNEPCEREKVVCK